MSENKPNWATSEAPRSETEVTIEPESSLSVKERIERARERGIELSKRSNAHPMFGLRDRDFWTDFAGPQTSEYDAKVLLCQLSLLEEPRFMNWRETKWVNLGGFFERRKRCWISGDSVVPVAHLRAAVDARTKELNLDPVLVAEFYAEPHSIDEDRQFLNLSFEERMQRFRSPAIAAA